MNDIVPFIRSFIEDPEMALVVILLALAVIAFFKQWVVPKAFYDKIEQRAVSAENALIESTAAIKELTVEIRQRSAR